ncbi:unnamed protein product [Urochloa humidicola]
MEPRAKKQMKTEAEAAEVEPKQQNLPDDLVLEIVARCRTIAGVIRFAAASKPIRRGILNAPFLLVASAASSSAAAANMATAPRPSVGSSSAFTTGTTTWIARRRSSRLPTPSRTHYPRRSSRSRRHLPATSPPETPTAAAASASSAPTCPVASCRSLLVLRRRCRNGGSRDHLAARHGTHPVEISVCNPATGERRVLPPHGVDDMSHTLLDADTFAFKLLVAEISINAPSTLCTHVFSSQSGEWAAPIACPIARRRGGRQVPCEFAGLPKPVVVGDTVHWLCTTEFGDCILTWRWRGAVEEHEALIVKLPRGYQLPELKKCLVVLPPPPGSEASLGFVYLERGEIVVWARERRSGMKWKWKLWRRIQEESIPRPVNLWDGWLAGAELSCYCEGSGTLLLRAGDEAMSPLLLDMENLEVVKLDARKWELNLKTEFCPYEIDMLSYMLFLMKRF